MSDAVPAAAPIAPPLGVDRETFTLAYVAAHEAQCPACGYNMHAITVARCPECGRPFEVRLVAPVNVSKAWIVLLITTAIGAGVGLLLAAVCIRAGLPPLHEVNLRFTVIYFLVNIPLPALVFLLRRPLSRIPMPLKWAICLLTTISTVGMICFLFNQID